MNSDNRARFLINTAYFLVIAVSIFLAYKYLLGFLLPFLVALLIGVAVQKPSVKLSKRLKISPRTIAPILAIFIYLALGSGIFLIVFYLFSNIQPAVKGMVGTISNAADTLSALFSKYSDFSSSLPKEISEMLSKLPQNIAEKGMSVLTGAASGIVTFAAKNIPSFFFSFIITIMASVYFARDFKAVKDFALSVVPKSKHKGLYKIKNILFANVFKMAKGYGTLILITFGELVLGFFIIGIESAVFYAAIISLVDALPVLGVGIVLLPWAVINIISGSVAQGIMLAVLYLIITIIRNILEPKILSARLGIPPLLSLLIIFCGLKLFGFFGMLLAFISLVIYIDYYREQ